MKKSTKQSVNRPFFRMTIAGIVFFAGSAAAETLGVDDSQVVDARGITEKMNESLGEVQNSMMAILSDGIRKKIVHSADPIVAEAMQETVMKERILYKKVHPLMVEKCATVTAPGKAGKMNIVNKKKTESVAAPDSAVFLGGKRILSTK